MVEECLRDLEWLGLDWDGPVRIQSRELASLGAALGELLERGLAYACICSRKDIELAASAPHLEDGELRYPGTCRYRYASPATAERESGRSAAIRFRVPRGKIVLEDGFAGRFANDVQAEAGDFVIARRDGVFAYQLAVVVDDARMGVNEVVRGADLLPSAARQWLLQEALGLPHPAWFHVPLVVDESGRRLAKRRDDASLAALRKSGVDARRVVQWIARSAGLEADEPVSAAEVVGAFDIHRLPREPVVLTEGDVERLRRP